MFPAPKTQRHPGSLPLALRPRDGPASKRVAGPPGSALRVPCTASRSAPRRDAEIDMASVSRRTDIAADPARLDGRPLPSDKDSRDGTPLRSGLRALPQPPGGRQSGRLPTAAFACLSDCAPPQSLRITPGNRSRCAGSRAAPTTAHRRSDRMARGAQSIAATTAHRRGVCAGRGARSIAMLSPRAHRVPACTPLTQCADQIRKGQQPLRDIAADDSAADGGAVMTKGKTKNKTVPACSPGYV